MSLTLRAGLFQFELIGSDGQTVRRCVASSLRVAHAALAPGKGEFVTSAASRRLGAPHALAAGVCRGCGQRPAEPGRHQQAERCAKCQPSERPTAKNTGSRDSTLWRLRAPVRSVERREPIASAITPALLASLRAELDDRMRAAVVPGKRGRPRSRGITTGTGEAAW